MVSGRSASLRIIQLAGNKRAAAEFQFTAAINHNTGVKSTHYADVMLEALVSGTFTDTSTYHYLSTETACKSLRSFLIAIEWNEEQSSNKE